MIQNFFHDQQVSVFDRLFLANNFFPVYLLNSKIDDSLISAKKQNHRIPLICGKNSISEIIKKTKC